MHLVCTNIISTYESYDMQIKFDVVFKPCTYIILASSLAWYLHALNSSAVACDGGNIVVGPLGDRESCGRLEAGERCNHAGLSRGGTVNGGDGGR